MMSLRWKVFLLFRHLTLKMSLRSKFLHLSLSLWSIFLSDCSSGLPFVSFFLPASSIGSSSLRFFWSSDSSFGSCPTTLNLSSLKMSYTSVKVSVSESPYATKSGLPSPSKSTVQLKSQVVTHSGSTDSTISVISLYFVSRVLSSSIAIVSVPKHTAANIYYIVKRGSLQIYW